MLSELIRFKNDTTQFSWNWSKVESGLVTPEVGKLVCRQSPGTLRGPPMGKALSAFPFSHKRLQ